MPHTFTSIEAVELFERHTGFHFHPTVPGQLLARRRISKIDADASRRAVYDAKHLSVVWEDMMALAIHRCRYDLLKKPPRPFMPASVKVSPQVAREKEDAAASAKKPVKARARCEPVRAEARSPWRFIDVPFAEKEAAKSLGAKWHALAKLWYVPQGVLREKFHWPDASVPDELMEELVATEAIRKEAMADQQARRHTGRDPARYRATNKILEEAESRLAIALSKED